MRNPALPFIRSLYPKNESPVTRNGNWIGLMTHSLEAPDKPNMARSLAEGWFRNPGNETSVSAIVDRGEVIQSYEFLYKTWGCGNGNDFVVVQTEHVGYAAWTTAQWTTPTMLQMLRNSARHQAWCWYEIAMKGKGITYYPEWLSLTQIAAASRSGLLTHDDARRVWGGTTHTDPGKNFPYKLVRDYIHEELDKLTGKSSQPVDAERTYKVRKGDTLSGIAYRLLGDASKWREIAALNNISNPESLAVGQVLTIVEDDMPYTEDQLRKIIRSELQASEDRQVKRMPFWVWAYTNAKLTKTDAYGYLRDIAAKVTGKS